MSARCRRSLHAARPALALAAHRRPGAAGATPAAGPTAGRRRSEPIEITADRLVLEQNQQIATFTGNVDAVQGEMTPARRRCCGCSTPASEERQADAGEPAERPADRGRGQRAASSSPSETATGNSGVYDLSPRKMVLIGNVVLTSGDNVVKGDRLDMDLQHRHLHGQLSRPATRAGAQRVRALFVPEKKAS